MGLLDRASLSATLNNLTAAVLSGRELPAAQRAEVATWIAARMKQPGYCGLPAPTRSDYRSRPRLFTGDRSTSGAGTGCKLGFEAAWALAVLKPRAAEAARAARRCREIVLERFARQATPWKGMYCCPSCSSAGWRALSCFGDAEAEKYLHLGARLLRSFRDGAGRWRRFPFWYSVLGLCQARDRGALAELRYAAPALEKALRGAGARGAAANRKLLASYVLARV